MPRDIGLSSLLNDETCMDHIRTALPILGCLLACPLMMIICMRGISKKDGCATDTADPSRLLTPEHLAHLQAQRADLDRMIGELVQPDWQTRASTPGEESDNIVDGVDVRR